MVESKGVAFRSSRLTRSGCRPASAPAQHSWAPLALSRQAQCARREHPPAFDSLRKVQNAVAFCLFYSTKNKEPAAKADRLFVLVESKGVEPSTFALRTRRSTN